MPSNFLTAFLSFALCRQSQQILEENVDFPPSTTSTEKKSYASSMRPKGRGEEEVENQGGRGALRVNVCAMREHFPLIN